MFNYNQETIYSLLCAVLPCFIYLLVWGRKKPLLHSVWVMIFVLYCWQVYDITGAGGLSDILYRPEGSINPSFIQGTVNLIPFQNFTTGFFLNILMCVPLGLLLPFVWKAYRKFRVTVLSGAGFSALIEVSQLLTTRATDIDDLIANTLGTAVGFAVWFAFAKLFGQRMKTTVDGSKEVRSQGCTSCTSVQQEIICCSDRIKMVQKPRKIKVFRGFTISKRADIV